MEVRLQEFKQYYQECFIDNHERTAEELITPPIPIEDQAYNNVVVRGYIFLSSCKMTDIGHMKILSNYDKLLRKNRESGMDTHATEFATILYILHRFCVRLLQYPWRKEFFSLKTYNGFFRYTFSKHLTSTVTKELLHLMGFEIEDVHTYRLRWININDDAKLFLTNAGIDFFLSYVYCRARNDADFKGKVKSLSRSLLPFSVRKERSSGSPSKQRSARNEEESSSRHQGRYSDYPMESSSTAPRTISGRHHHDADLYASAVPTHPGKTIHDVYVRNKYHSIPYEDLYGSESNSKANLDTYSRKRPTPPSSPARGTEFNTKINIRVDSLSKQNESTKSLSSRKLGSGRDHSSSKLAREARGSPDGGIDGDKDFFDRSSDRPVHIYRHTR